MLAATSAIVYVWLVFALVAVQTTSGGSTYTLGLARGYAVDKKDGRFSKQLLDLASIASISALPSHAEDVIKASKWLEQRLTQVGMENVQVLPTKGPQPVVYADWMNAPGKPTILIYGHYDVQPVDPLELWESPPFEPTLKKVDGQSYFYGRGVDDDKGGVMEAIQAIESYLATSKSLPLNIKLLLEGQEEIGSPNLEDFLHEHKHGVLAGADIALSADGGQITADQPGIGTGLRGAVALEVQVSTAALDLHSGLKGGSVENANHALISLLASLKDENERVTVKGFYDAVAEMTPEDKETVRDFPFSADAEKQALGVLGFKGEQGFNTLEHRWYRPTLEVVGMWGGFTGEGMKTVIPRVANAKLSCRLVPNMEPADIAAKVKAHLQASAPPLANVSVTVSGFRAYPWVSPRDTPGNQLAAEVLEKVMQNKPVYYRDGGTIPALTYFQQILGLDSTIFAFGLGDHIHAPNERVLESLFHTGRLAWVELLAVLGEKLGDKLPVKQAAAAAEAGSSARGKDEL